MLTCVVSTNFMTYSLGLYLAEVQQWLRRLHMMFLPDYCVNTCSPVFVCSLDAEGAFDGIPHAVLFVPHNVMGIIPDISWRILVLWYKGLTVRIKWNGKIGEEISVFKGTRQGGLSSPFLFITHFIKI